MKRRDLIIATILSLSVAILTACGDSEEGKKTNVVQSATVPQEMISTEENNSTVESTSKEPQTEEITTEEPTTKPQKTITKLSKMTEYSSKDSVKDWREYKYDVKGNLIFEKGSDVGDTFVYEYNKDNKISIIYSSNWEMTKEKNSKKYEYNENGYLEKIYGKNLLLEEYEYNANGNMIKKVEYNDDMSISQSYTYEYDSNNRLTKDVLYNSSGNLRKWNSYSYDTNGNLTEEKNYSTFEDPVQAFTYKYDEQGKLIRKDREIYWSDRTDKYYYIYEYDADGNLTKETNYICQEDGDVINFYRVYEYSDIVVEME